MTRRPAAERLFTPAFLALGVAELCYFTAVGVAIFALPLYVTGPIGGDDAAAGLAFGAFALSALVLRPIAGRLADVHGRRPLLIGGALLAATSLGLLALAENFVVIVALRLLAGVAEAAFFVAGFAALADLAPPARLGEALSYNSLGLYLGIALGPPLGEALVRTAGFGLAWAGAAALAVAAAGLSLLVGETRAGPPPEAGERHFIHRPALADHARVPGLAGGDGRIPRLRIAVHRARRTREREHRAARVRRRDRRLPYRLRARPRSAAAARPRRRGPRHHRPRARPRRVVAVARRPAPGGGTSRAVGVAFSTPAFFSAIFATASPSQRGVASGTASAAIDLGLGIGPILLGLVAEPFGIRWAFGVGAAVAGAGAMWTLLLRRRSSADRSSPPVTTAGPAE